MNEENDVIVRPKTSCQFKKNSVVACDDYIKPEGEKDYSCCKKCGWNPDVAKVRLDHIVAMREKQRKVRAS